MASTYSDLLRLEKQADGENDTTWGAKVNTVFEMIEDAVAGRAAVTHDDSASYTLTTNNSATDEARNMMLAIGGALTAGRNAVVPTSSKLYFAKNSTTGGFAVTVKTAAGTGIAVPNGKSTALICDGTNVVDAIDWLSSLTVAGALTVGGAATITSGTITGITDLTVADGGTGRSTSTTAYGLLAAGTTATGAHQTLAAGATTEILVGGGAAALPVWTTATGSGAPVRATSPTLTTPVLGVATATSLNGLTITTSTGTLTVTNAKTLSVSNTLTLAGTDGKTLTVSHSLTIAGTDGTTMTFPASSANVAALNIENQTLAGGVVVTAKDLGEITTGTVTPDPGDRPIQQYENGGAHILAPSSNVGITVVEVTNNASAGAITTSGFDLVDGDSFTTTDGDVFICTITITPSKSLLQVIAMQ